MRPHPSFLLALAWAVVAVFVALGTDGPVPGVALGSRELHRVLVGAAVFGVGYVVAALLWLAWSGTIAGLQVPGGGGLDPSRRGASSTCASLDPEPDR